MNVRRIALTVCLLLVVSWMAVIPASAFAAPWSAPQDLSSASTFIFNPSIGFDRAGAGLASWEWFQGVGADAQGGTRFATRALSSGFAPERSAPRLLPSPLIYGRGHVFWRGEQDVVRGRRHLTRVQVAFGRTTGFISRPRTVATDEVLGALAAAVNDRGQIAMAYIRTNRGRSRAVKLFVSRGRDLGRGRIVSPRGATGVTVAVGQRGEIVVAWERNGRIEARIRRPHHHLGRIIFVGRGARYHTRLRAAVSATGRVWLAWASQSLSEGGTNGPFELLTSVSAHRGRTFQRARLLDRFDPRASDEANFDLDVDYNGNGLVAWSSFDGKNFRARLATITPTGRRASFTTLSQPGYDAAVGNLALGPAGDAVVVWAQLDALRELGDVVFADRVAPDGSYTGEERVSGGDRARNPSVAFNPRTDVPTVVWSQRVGPDGPGVPLADIRTFVRASDRTPPRG